MNHHTENAKASTIGKDRPATAFDVVNDTLNSVMILATRIEALADALLGPVPATASNGSVEPMPSGVLPKLQMNAEYARRRLNEAAATLGNVEKALLP